jgi:hypothetical protein
MSKIGATVNKIRKIDASENKDLADLATEVLLKWKSILLSSSIH